VGGIHVALSILFLGPHFSLHRVDHPAHSATSQ
jgi:hypothetical protein